MTDNTGNKTTPDPQDPQKKNSHSSQPDDYEKATGWDENGNPHFGQMRSQYGPNYNPYRYGAPQPENTSNNRSQNGRHQQNVNRNNGNSAWNNANPGWGDPRNGYPNGSQNGQNPQGFGPQGFGPYPYGPQGPQGSPNGPQGSQGPYAGPQNGPQGPQNPYGAPNSSNPYGPTGQYRNPQGGWNPPQGSPQANQQGQNQYPYGNPYASPYNMPFSIQQINPDDPNQNPWYGKWDWIAIFAFIFSLTGYFCFIALPLGFFAYRRETTLHMKGKGFAIAAIIISILEILSLLFLLFNPGLMQTIMSSVDLGSGSAAGLIQTLFLH